MIKCKKQYLMVLLIVLILQHRWIYRTLKFNRSVVSLSNWLEHLIVHHLFYRPDLSNQLK